MNVVLHLAMAVHRATSAEFLRVIFSGDWSRQQAFSLLLVALAPPWFRRLLLAGSQGLNAGPPLGIVLLRALGSLAKLLLGDVDVVVLWVDAERVLGNADVLALVQTNLVAPIERGRTFEYALAQRLDWRVRLL